MLLSIVLHVAVIVFFNRNEYLNSTGYPAGFDQPV